MFKLTGVYVCLAGAPVRNVERLAIISQKEWEKWLALLEKSSVLAEVKYYKMSNIKDAWNWIESS